MNESTIISSIFDDIQKSYDESILQNKIQKLNPYIIDYLINKINQQLDSCDWKTKINYLRLYILLVKLHPELTLMCLPNSINKIKNIITDIKKPVKETTISLLLTICDSITNLDIKPIAQYIINAYSDPVSQTKIAIDKLYSTTFVSDIDTGCLALIIPILLRSLQEKDTVYKRRSVVILDNITKLISNPIDALIFYSTIENFLKKIEDQVQFIEIRNVSKRALNNLDKLISEIKSTNFTEDELRKHVIESIHSSKIENNIQINDSTIDYMTNLLVFLLKNRISDENIWNRCTEPYIETSKEIIKPLIKKCKSKINLDEESIDTSTENDLCNIEFSLAYGSIVLLYKTRLHLKKGKKYGLIGPNGAGKSTLMRSISNNTLIGFPSELKTVYVEHKTEEYVDTVINYLGEEYTIDEKINLLTELGFSDYMQNLSVVSLSGGWRMKLYLAKAIIQKPDILLLDEPTNHLDIDNVNWITNYIKNLKDISCLIVSHDTNFIDTVCTDIIHYEKNKKLKNYVGTLKDFVKINPDAKYYYKISTNDIYKFNFPDPGPLLGVKSLTKAILKLRNFTFQYPNTIKPQLLDINAQCSLASRIAIIGSNGAGKSTLVKLMIGELTPTINTEQAEYYKHENLRIAYVAQHAFHHIEKHLDKSPVEYIMWRYSSGIDKEQIDKEITKMTPEELEQQEKKLKEAKLKKISKICSRIKGKRGNDYYVLFEDSIIEKLFTSKELEELGYSKLMEEFDLQMAMELSSGRKLTRNEIQKHLDTFGLSAELGIHGKISGLSGGQKMKVTMAASTWNLPHLIILDEPSNFLDRASLSALSSAIKDFKGGIIIISHNSEFVKDLCPEKWYIKDGKISIEGAEWMNVIEQARLKAERDAKKKLPNVEEDKYDNFGNLLESNNKPIGELDRKKRKELEKKRKEMIKRGEDTYEIDEILGKN